MRVDAAGKQVLPGRVDHMIGADVQRLADEGDPLAVHEHVGDVVVGRSDHAATFDEHGHCGSPSLG